MPNLATMSDSARVKSANTSSASTLLSSESTTFASKPDASGNISTYRLSAFDAAGLPEELKEWTFQLVKSNMEAIYKSADWAWDDAEKRKEMLEENGRYLVVYPESGEEPVGMVYFQFTMEDDGDRSDDRQLPCIYCYEIQLTPQAQGKGIGKHLMKLLEDLGKRYGMRKCMLTVLRLNKQATAFYNKIGYTIDLISPSKCMPKHKWKKIPYEIMSRKL